MSLYEHASGAHMHANYFRPGGVAKDLPKDFDQMCSGTMKTVSKFVTDLEILLNDNRIFRSRSVDIGVISKGEAINWGFTGPPLRASGVPWDLRKASPYEVYDRLEFKIPVGSKGDCFDRYMVRIFEMKESLGIIEQCLEQMPGGPFIINDYKIAPPPREEMKASMEALIHHFKLFSEGFHVPKGEVYRSVEAPKGEFGIYLVSTGTNKPYRCKIRPPVLPFFRPLKRSQKDICWPMCQLFWALWTLYLEKLIDETNTSKTPLGSYFCFLRHKPSSH